MIRAAQWLVSGMFLALIALVIGALFLSPDPDFDGHMVESAVTPTTQTLVNGGMVSVVPAAWNRAAMVPSQPPAAYFGQKMKLSEGHWQGMDAMPLSVELKTKLQLPMNLQGVLLGETTMAAAASGLLAGDVLVAVERVPINSLEALQSESKRVADRDAVNLTAYRKGQMFDFVMRSPEGPLGFAQMETAPMIQTSDQRPHAYRGPCTDCHAIGSTGHITPDPDGILLPAPVIRAGVRRPHSDRGPCQACHVVTNG